MDLPFCLFYLVSDIVNIRYIELNIDFLELFIKSLLLILSESVWIGNYQGEVIQKKNNTYRVSLIRIGVSLIGAQILTRKIIGPEIKILLMTVFFVRVPNYLL